MASPLTHSLCIDYSGSFTVQLGNFSLSLILVRELGLYNYRDVFNTTVHVRFEVILMYNPIIILHTSINIDFR